MKHSIQGLQNKALELGFQSVGVSKAYRLDKEAQQLESWLNNNYHGEMNYMERYFDLRIDPRLLLPEAKSVIVLSMNYYQELENSSNPKIAKYAYGQDYHKVMKKKSKLLESWMKFTYGDIHFRAFVDSAPIMERAWAEKSGISWSGKNTLSINPKTGSYFFLMCILTDLEFEETVPIKDHCGTCRKCIEACPTEAIHEKGYLLDASKCISYLTIELKNEIPSEFSNKMENWAFGCDICQEVCPWNRFSQKTKIEEFSPNHEILGLSATNWEELSEESWKVLSQKSPLKRTGLAGMKRNIRFLKKNSKVLKQSED